MLTDPTLPIVLSGLAGGTTLAVLAASLRDPRRRPDGDSPRPFADEPEPVPAGEDVPR
jgi:hypothetical protein